MKRIRINPEIRLTDPVVGEVRNMKTGQVFDLSAEAIALVAVFSEPREVGDDLAGVETFVEGDDTDALRSFVADLLGQGVLVDVLQAQQPQRRTPTQISDEALVEKPYLPILGFPVASLDSEYPYTVAVLGVPFDLGATGYPGARFGPQRLRELSANGGDYQASFADLAHTGIAAEDGRRLCRGVRVVDIGDVIHQVGEPQQRFYDRAEAAASAVRSRGAMPVAVGGDHSCLYPLVRSAYRALGGSIHLVSLDAHSDLADYDDDICHNHGNVVSRLIAEGIVSAVTYVGLRGQVGDLRGNAKIRAVYADPFADAAEMVSRIPVGEDELVYLSVDVDVIDPAFAPGTGTPVPLGLAPQAVLAYARDVIGSGRVVGLDVVEYNPMRDVGDATGNLLLHLLPRLIDGFVGSSS